MLHLSRLSSAGCFPFFALGPVLLFALAVVSPARGADAGDGVLISDLPLRGDLQDRITGHSAEFTRPSSAYDLAGGHVSPNTPRFERFAVAAGFEWTSFPRKDRLMPVAVANGWLWASNRWNLAVTADGENFSERFAFDETLESQSSVFVSPRGTLLVATGYNMLGICTLWRGTDEGRTFEPVLVAASGLFTFLSYSHNRDTLYLAEYGPLTGDNARRIYRSRDDGRTWSLVYEPPPREMHHNHHPVADEWSGRVFVSFGDYLKGILVSDDAGDSWRLLHDHYTPTSGLARPDGVYWGLEGNPPGAIARYEPATNRWSLPFRAWRGYRDEFARSRVPWVWTMLDHAGLIYAPFAREGNEMFVSADGRHWAFAWAMPIQDAGVLNLVGAYGGWIHALYGYRFYLTGAPLDHHWLKFRPGDVATFDGLRLEPPTVNLIEDPAASSFETGLEGWTIEGDGDIVQVQFDPYHGHLSVQATDRGAGRPMRLLSPPLETPVPPNQWVYARIWFRGDEADLRLYLIDEAAGSNGFSTLTMACDEWDSAMARMYVTNPHNRLRLVIEANALREDDVHYVFDALKFSTEIDGSTWQPGGTPRAPETLRARVEYPAEWTDFLCFHPDFSSEDPSDQPRTIKAWIEDEDHVVRVAFCPASARIALLRTIDGEEEILAETEPVEFWPGWTLRIGVECGLEESRIMVRIGAWESEGAGAPFAISPREFWLGASPDQSATAPGIYGLCRTFTGRLTAEQRAAELTYLPPDARGRIRRGDGNCDHRLDFQDIDAFILALVDARDTYLASGYEPHCWVARNGWADIDENGTIDFIDLVAFVDCLARGTCEEPHTRMTP